MPSGASQRVAVPSHRFPLSEAREAFEAARTTVLKVQCLFRRGAARGCVAGPPPGFQKRIAKPISLSNSPLPLPRAAYPAAAKSTPACTPYRR